MRFATSADTLELICAEFGRVPTVDAADAANLSRFIAEFRENFDRQDRSASEAAQYCLERFVNSEFDFTTPGMRGLGRMTEQIPRFAAKHRARLTELPPSALDELKYLLSCHITCGRLFLELNFNLPPVDKTRLTKDSLFNRWVHRIYLPPKDLLDVQYRDESLLDIWFRATSQPFREAVIKSGIDWDDRDVLGAERVLLTHYFTAGTTLRYTEAELSKS
ncbi:MAG: hypothetical protein J5I93_05320 [Pirellulaceae bacterium]|nr:hypothetical protein [Pirellulaceae bacterium]